MARAALRRSKEDRIAGLAGFCESRNACVVAIDPLIIKSLGGSKKVAAALDMTPSGLWRLTRPGADVLPKRQRQLIDLARRAGVPLDYADFHRDFEAGAAAPSKAAPPSKKVTPAKQKGKTKAAQAVASQGGKAKAPLARRASDRGRR